MQSDFVGVTVQGRGIVFDTDTGEVLVDKSNAIHPQNMSRIIARALTGEPNSSIYRIAFGNGGTSINAALNVTYNPPNDGQPPDASTWDSRLYHETYSEVIDSRDVMFKRDPGSADVNTGSRPSGGSSPLDDPATVPFVSGPGVRSIEMGITSQVVIECTLNSNEPSGQFNNDMSTNADFVFDEIGIYTAGAPALNTSGYHRLNVGNKTSVDWSGLSPNTTYQLKIQINNGSPQLVTFITPSSGSGTGTEAGKILFGDLCKGLTSHSDGWVFVTGAPLSDVGTGAHVAITDYTGNFAPTLQAGTQTYGFLNFVSNTTGDASSIDIDFPENAAFFDALNGPAGSGASVEQRVMGKNKGVQNDPINPAREQERLLAHLIFSPVLKAKNRSQTIRYYFTISVARTPRSS